LELLLVLTWSWKWVLAMIPLWRRRTQDGAAAVSFEVARANDTSHHPSVNETQLVCIDPEHVRSIWPLVAPLLRQAIAKTGLSAFATIEREILDGTSLLWIAWNDGGIEAAASTSLQQTDAGKVCVITACAGAEMTRWVPLIRDIEAYAQAEGCHCVRIFGRKGWARVLDGYKQTYAIIDKRFP
jgi:hypothetical protein